MPIKTTATQFGIIKVGHKTRENTEPLILHILDRDAFDATMATLKRNGEKVVDAFWGYRSYETSADALADLAIYNL